LFTPRLVICANKVNRFNFDFTGTLTSGSSAAVHKVNSDPYSSSGNTGIPFEAALKLSFGP